jgi:hypothetical protein
MELLHEEAFESFKSFCKVQTEEAVKPQFTKEGQLILLPYGWQRGYLLPPLGVIVDVSHREKQETVKAALDADCYWRCISTGLRITNHEVSAWRYTKEFLTKYKENVTDMKDKMPKLETLAEADSKRITNNSGYPFEMETPPVTAATSEKPTQPQTPLQVSPFAYSSAKYPIFEAPVSGNNVTIPSGADVPCALTADRRIATIGPIPALSYLIVKDGKAYCLMLPNGQEIKFNYDS